MTDRPLGVVEFGRALLVANDLDPVYTLLWHADWRESDPVRFRRWLLAYWCFYHVGTASWAADGQDAGCYWERMRTAAGSKAYPRSSERRHFRGENARKSVEYLGSRGSGALWDDLLQAGPAAADVVAAVRRWVGFGPWIAFKVADMLERLAVRPVTFDLDTAMYDSPRKAAEDVWDAEFPPRESSPQERLAAVLGLLSTGLGSEPAPPSFDRPLGFQEYETVLCKWKSYRSGHYHVGEDVAACRAGWSGSPGPGQPNH